MTLVDEDFKEKCSVFPLIIDKLLKNHLDQPHLNGLVPDAFDMDGVASNSLKDLYSLVRPETVMDNSGPINSRKK